MLLCLAEVAVSDGFVSSYVCGNFVVGVNKVHLLFVTLVSWRQCVAGGGRCM